MTRPFTGQMARAVVQEFEPVAFIAEAEIPAENPDGTPYPPAQDWADLDFHLSDLPIDKSVATSFAPFQKWRPDHNGIMRLLPAPEKAKVLIENGWYCQPYVYPAESLGDTVAGKLAYATHFTHEAAPNVLEPGQGWYRPEPVLGTYCGAWGCFELNSPAFNGKETCAGYSIWDAGEEF
jgi:hypothetical protein